jgi:hypothetical protein
MAVMNWKLFWKETVGTHFTYYPDFELEGMKKTPKISLKASGVLGQIRTMQPPDTNPELPLG